MSGEKGFVFGTQYFSIRDGAGIRTSVFLGGCPLKCVWCHNPEGAFMEASLAYAEARCVGCGRCAKACPGAHKINGEKHSLERSSCVKCFRCVGECKAGALEKIGGEVFADELVVKLLRDRRYYDTTGGGVTLTGGEPAVQFEFAVRLLEICKKEGLNTAVETCGYMEKPKLDEFMRLTDTFLFDLKESDPARHIEATGYGNELILSNMEYLFSRGARLILRCPVIPGLNDRDDHFGFIAGLTKRNPSCLGAEVMPYHRLGTAKCARFGLPAPREFRVPGEAEVSGWIEKIKERGGRIVDYEKI
ncbi:MAG: glycyl-radical enzyme activating protein [Defluviitaleaceae bacterium]|nr:glycyl-radical enzyme activating protein [Defluviitaleaceae bacterium]